MVSKEIREFYNKISIFLAPNNKSIIVFGGDPGQYENQTLVTFNYDAFIVLDITNFTWTTPKTENAQAVKYIPNGHTAHLYQDYVIFAFGKFYTFLSI